MEKEENQNSTSADQNQDGIKENEKPEENVVKENKQETHQEPRQYYSVPEPSRRCKTGHRRKVELSPSDD